MKYTPMFASDFGGLMQLLVLVPAVLLLLAMVGLVYAKDGNRWALVIATLPIAGGCFFTSLVLFYADQLGVFLCFWLPLPLITGILSLVLLLVRRRRLLKKDD
ncbi:MAG: hypothetical protein HOP33_22660 [Verrucomicrobia bacterium]|nr:hypothetical protein [Verrucomicrobiota bacterium]